MALMLHIPQSLQGAASSFTTLPLGTLNFILCIHTSQVSHIIHILLYFHFINHIVSDTKLLGSVFKNPLVRKQSLLNIQGNRITKKCDSGNFKNQYTKGNSNNIFEHSLLEIRLKGRECFLKLTVCLGIPW